jgi:CRISPR-associated protein (TIGR03984 family)
MNNTISTPPTIEEFTDNDALWIWLEEQANKDNRTLMYLLAHAEDGVIWGRFDEGKLTTAETIFCKPDFKVDFPTLRLPTLQQCRVFGQNGEVFLWWSGEKWRSRFIGNPEVDKITESRILWGTHGKEKDGFTLLWDGSQGLRHAVPLTNIFFDKEGKKRPVRLLVHHYIKYDDQTGLARISLSRLVDLTTDKN